MKIKKIITVSLFIGMYLLMFNFNSVNNENYFQSYVIASTLGATDTNVKTSSANRTGTVTMDMNGLDNPFAHVLLWILLAIATLIGLMVDLINFALSDTLNSIYNSDGLLTGWKAVRDFLNIFFIFFLLFSAFATIFQVSKYHIKSTWVMIVVMALLVNFSWPISRVLIDVSNVTMSYIIGDNGNSATSSGLMAKLGENANFVDMMIGSSYFTTKKGSKIGGDASGLMPALIIGIIIGAIFLFTVGAIAMILLIRVILLAVLLVFSSAGFVLMAFPSTRAIASQWWDAFNKQIFLGPIILFSLLLSVTVMDAMSNEFSAASGGLSEVFKSMPQYAVAIILIWTGILAAQKISGESAGMALNVARKTRGIIQRGGLKTGKFVGRTGANTADSISGGRISSGIAKVHGVSDGWKKRFNNAEEGRKKRYNETKENMSARTEALAHDKGGIDGYGANKNAITAHENKKVAEMKKKHKEDNTDAVTLANELDGADKVKTRAIIESLSGMKEGVDENVIKKMVKSGDKIKGNKVLEKAITKKAAETGNSHVVYDNELNTQYKMKAKSAGKDISQLNSMERKTVKSNVSKDVYSGMDGKTFAKQKETIKRIDENNAGFLAIGEDLQGKLERASFAKEMQNVDSETYERLQNINDTHL